jgi:hypothetical protein
MSFQPSPVRPTRKLDNSTTRPNSTKLGPSKPPDPDSDPDLDPPSLPPPSLPFPPSLLPLANDRNLFPPPPPPPPPLPRDWRQGRWRLAPLSFSGSVNNTRASSTLHSPRPLIRAGLAGCRALRVDAGNILDSFESTSGCISPLRAAIKLSCSLGLLYSTSDTHSNTQLDVVSFHLLYHFYHTNHRHGASPGD